MYNNGDNHPHLHPVGPRVELTPQLCYVLNIPCVCNEALILLTIRGRMWHLTLTSDRFHHVTAGGGDLSREAHREKEWILFFLSISCMSGSECRLWSAFVSSLCFFSHLFPASRLTFLLHIGQSAQEASRERRKKNGERKHWGSSEKQLFKQPVMLRTAKERLVIALTRRTIYASFYFLSPHTHEPLCRLIRK